MQTYVGMCRVLTPGKEPFFILVNAKAHDSASAAGKIAEHKFTREWWTDKSRLIIVQIQTLDEMHSVPNVSTPPNKKPVRRRRRR